MKRRKSLPAQKKTPKQQRPCFSFPNKTSFCPTPPPPPPPSSSAARKGRRATKKLGTELNVLFLSLSSVSPVSSFSPLLYSPFPPPPSRLDRKTNSPSLAPQPPQKTGGGNGGRGLTSRFPKCGGRGKINGPRTQFLTSSPLLFCTGRNEKEGKGKDHKRPFQFESICHGERKGEEGKGEKKPWLAWRRRQRPISGPASFLFFPEKPKPLPTQPFKAESGSPQPKMGKDGKFLSLFFLFGFSSRVRAQSKGKKEGVTDRSDPPLLEPKTPWGEMSRKYKIF